MRSIRLLNLALIFAVGGIWTVNGVLAQGEQAPPPPATAEAAKPQAATLPASSGVKLPSPVVLPMREGSVKIAVIGDTGSGKPEQFEVGRMLNTYQIAFPFDSVLMVGDNIYGPEKAHDMKAKFEDAYQSMLDKGVKFYASLGNHDGSNQRFYQHFNMNGEEYYKLEKGGVSFYALNSNYMDKRQLEWFTTRLAEDTNKWKIAFFHHPPFSSGKFHGSDESLRKVLHPIFVKHGVDVVFTGHDHFYERIKPQDGITYFVAGSSGQLRKGGVKKNSPLTAAAFDQDMTFMLVEIAGDELHFQALTRTGQTIDSGVIKRRGA